MTTTVILAMAMFASPMMDPAQAKPVVKEKRICIAGEPPLGTRVPAKRVCRTKAEWAAIEARKADTPQARGDLDRQLQQEEIERNVEQTGGPTR